ncbi:hypothetical protein D3C84_782050 [compost metagenome]|jgi:hypothetical protein
MLNKGSGDLKIRVIKKINTMYFSAIIGLILTTIYTTILMIFVTKTFNKVK